ncbi:hypothetical protein [Undibacterium sp. Di24W]|uniref:hypothetical protein n=1 Tax=Undibacterium sp. Di24W TaxID=3413033 RepID=UPI003BF1953A
MTDFEIAVVDKYFNDYLLANGLAELNSEGVAKVQALIRLELGSTFSFVRIVLMLQSLGWTKTFRQDGPSFRQCVYSPPTTKLTRAKKSINLDTLQIFLQQAAALVVEGESFEAVDKYLGAAIYVVHVMQGQSMNDEIVDGINAAYAE